MMYNFKEEKNMNNIERKLVDNTLEYNEWLKNLNNELQLERKALKDKLKDKIENNQFAKEKLDYYRRQGANFIIWKSASQEFPDRRKECLCKCFENFDDDTNYKLLVYKPVPNRWFFRNGALYEGKVIEYAELPNL